jgi:putative oxidoreductase
VNGRKIVIAALPSPGHGRIAWHKTTIVLKMRNASVENSHLLARWAPLPLRAIVGFGFLQHGLAKAARGPDAFPLILQALGVPAPHWMGWATILVEICGGLAILLGAFVVLASLPMAVVLLVAIFTVHLPYGFSSIKLLAVTSAGAQFGPPGYECDLLYLAALAALVLGGAGPWSVDGAVRMRKLRNAAAHG